MMEDNMRVLAAIFRTVSTPEVPDAPEDPAAAEEAANRRALDISQRDAAMRSTMGSGGTSLTRNTTGRTSLTRPDSGAAQFFPSVPELEEFEGEPTEMDKLERENKKGATRDDYSMSRYLGSKWSNVTGTRQTWSNSRGNS